MKKKWSKKGEDEEESCDRYQGLVSYLTKDGMTPVDLKAGRRVKTNDFVLLVSIRTTKQMWRYDVLRKGHYKSKASKWGGGGVTEYLLEQNLYAYTLSNT